ncbi:MAG: 50S ribosomal protein L31 [Pseudomonas sp.]|jgi:large subunit ribosomal protein L31|uniref:50S ribosomal protein L31 n=1 Tax=Pseudomonas sp. TaxID=306 RepID=UPI003D0D3D59
MKDNIHPVYEAVAVTCSCGNKFETKSTLAKPLPVDVCNLCHPFYTGKQKTLDTGGRVKRFEDRFAAFGGKK